MAAVKIGQVRPARHGVIRFVTKEGGVYETRAGRKGSRRSRRSRRSRKSR